MNGIKLCFAEGQTKETVTNKIMEGLVPLARLFSDDRQFLTGANVSMADFVFYEHVNYANHLTKDLNEKTFTEFPKLEGFHQRMSNLPNLSEYLASEQHAATAAIWVPFPPSKVNLN